MPDTTTQDQTIPVDGLAVMLAILREHEQQRIRHGERLSRILMKPILGVLGHLGAVDFGTAVSTDAVYRELRRLLQADGSGAALEQLRQMEVAKVLEHLRSMNAVGRHGSWQDHSTNMGNTWWLVEAAVNPVALTTAGDIRPNELSPLQLT